MNNSQFTVKVTYNGTELKAECNKFQVAKHPQIYVVVKGEKKKDSLIHTFYEINEPDRKLFWFDHHDSKEPLRKAIAKALIGKLKRA